LIAALQHAATAGNLTAANSLQARLRPLWQAVDRDGTAAALKQALCLRHRPISAAVRLPLVDIEPEVGVAIEKALEILHQENSAQHAALPTSLACPQP
jgi:4-hydroxy-tetrahydrodipicolinate synthase